MHYNPYSGYAIGIPEDGNTLPGHRTWPLIMKTVMRIQLAILITLLLCTHAFAGYSQRISLAINDAPIATAFQKIQEQTGYIFFYDDAILPKGKNVTLRLSNAGLEETLKELFKEQPFKYQIVNKTIAVTLKTTATPTIQPQALAPQEPIKGMVFDEKGKPIAGVSVIVKGSTKGVVTGADGKFEIDATPDIDILVFRIIGFKEKERQIISRTYLAIGLDPSESQLDAIQVIGYGTTSRRFSTGNISSLSAEEIATQPVNNPILALAGRVPGLTVTQNSGIAGGGVTVRIQGLNSITRGTDPFYVVDGVPFTTQLLPNNGALLQSSGGQGSSFGAQNGNPLSFINPTDIESITVLKDADATAVYGSRAANGAILITTKKGKSGRTSLDINAQHGWGRVANRLPLLNTTQYLAMRREAYTNDGLPVPTHATPASQKNASNYDLTVWDSTINNDWQKLLIGGTSSYSDFQAALSGGSSTTTFKLAGGYHRETTVFPMDNSDTKVSFSTALNHSSRDYRFNVGFTANYVSDINKLPGSDFTAIAIALPPLTPNIYRTDGSLNWERIPSGTDSISTWSNPFSLLNQTYEANTQNLITSLNLNYKISNILAVKANIGYNSLQQKDYRLTPLSIYAPETRPIQQRGSTFSNGNISSWIIEPQLLFNKNIATGKLEALLGTTFQSNTSYNRRLSSAGYSSDLLLRDINSAATITPSGSIDSRYKYAAIFGRITYRIEDRYLFNLSGRRDGSSRFGSENSFHTFGAIGAGWIFSEENFVKNSIAFLSFGKLRSSYGVVGNDQIGDYEFYSLYTSPIGISSPYQNIAALSSTRIANPHLQWEVTKKFQTGLELGFLKDKLSFTVNYFRNISANQLVNYNLPYTAGITQVLRNFPARVENKGVEISIAMDEINLSDIKWFTSINITFSRNKLLDFPGLDKSSYANTLVIGRPIGGAKQFEFANIDKTTGLYNYYNTKGETTQSPVAADRTAYFSWQPAFFGGWQNQLTYKGMSLDLLFQFISQKGIDYSRGNLPGYFSSASSYTPTGSQPIYVLDRWTQPGQSDADVKKFGTTNNEVLYGITSSQSNLVVSDASFIRLKNVAISWEIPNRTINKAGMRSAKIFVHGQNLWTYTSYKGLDPETRSSNSLPPLRVYTLGINIGF